MQKIFNAALLILIFLPFSYLVDLVVYRTLMRRHRREQTGGSCQACRGFASPR